MGETLVVVVVHVVQRGELDVGGDRVALGLFVGQGLAGCQLQDVGFAVLLESGLVNIGGFLELGLGWAETSLRKREEDRE